MLRPRRAIIEWWAHVHGVAEQLEANCEKAHERVGVRLEKVMILPLRPP